MHEEAQYKPRLTVALHMKRPASMTCAAWHFSHKRRSVKQYFSLVSSYALTFISVTFLVTISTKVMMMMLAGRQITQFLIKPVKM